MKMWGRKMLEVVGRGELYYYLDLQKQCLSRVRRGSQPTQEGTKSAHQADAREDINCHDPVLLQSNALETLGGDRHGHVA